LRGGAWDHIVDFWAHAPRTLRIPCTPSGGNVLHMAMMAPLADPEAAAIPINPEPWTSCFPALAPVLRTLGDSAHAMTPTLAQGAGCAKMNALGLAVALETVGPLLDAAHRGEATERPLTDHTQRRAAEIAASHILASGMAWDDERLRAALHLPTGTPKASGGEPRRAL
jgi:2-methyl-3-hydroxypyridine 5-carboxylic acid dioxygenase